MGFLRTLARVLAPVSPVNFADFLLADILTSLAKSIADAERALCRFTVHRSQALLDPLDPRASAAQCRARVSRAPRDGGHQRGSLGPCQSH